MVPLGFVWLFSNLVVWHILALFVVVFLYCRSLVVELDEVANDRGAEHH